MIDRDSHVRVGVLSLHESKETKAILNAVEALGHDSTWLRRENVTFHIHDHGVTVEPTVDVVINRLLLSNTDQPVEGLGLINLYEGLYPVLNGSAAVLKAIHKFSTAITLDRLDIPVPESFLGLDHGNINDGRRFFSDQVVYKTAIGTHGGGTWLIDGDNPVDPMVGNRQAFLQEFVKTASDRHQDYRVYVVGEQVIGAMRRTARDGEWRTNVALGGDVEDATDDLPEAVGTLARRAAEAVGLDYAGVDVIEREGEWFILEVNPTAGFRGFFGATGVSPAPAIARMAIELAGGSVDESLVSRLSAELDDSTPSSTPVPGIQAAAERPAIGYTEEVVVSGTNGSEHVLAKSDTGASRTCIDLGLAAIIGVGPIKQRTRVKSGLSRNARSRPVVDLVIGIKGRWHTVTASIEDRSHMAYPVLLGRDILEHYHVDVTKTAEE